MKSELATPLWQVFSQNRLHSHVGKGSTFFGPGKMGGMEGREKILNAVIKLGRVAESFVLVVHLTRSNAQLHSGMS